MLIDDTCTYAFNNVKESTQEIVQKAKTLLDACHATLKFTGGYFNLNKCYWRLQDYFWHKGVFTYSTGTSKKIIVKYQSTETNIEHIPTNKMRTLFGAPIVSSYSSKKVEQFFRNKLTECISALKNHI